MDQHLFIQELHNTFDLIGRKTLSFNRDDYLTNEYLFKIVEGYATSRQLRNTLIALHVTRGLLFDSTETTVLKKDGVAPGIYFNHCLNIANLLIHLHTRLDYESEDLMLATAISHVLVEKVIFDGEPKEYFEKYWIDSRVYDLVMLNYNQKNYTKEEMIDHYHLIEQNPLALLVKLADRGNILEQLYESDVYKAQAYIQETKTYFMPMCIYGKENYHHLFRVFGLLMEKMRCLLDITDILSTAHIKRMNTYHETILALKEENARIRLQIKQIKEG